MRLEKDADRLYLLRDEGYGPEIVLGPIPAYDDTQFEEKLVSFLKDHPWDESIRYYSLFIDGKGKPEITDFLDSYIEELMAEAWGIELPSEDDEEGTEEDTKDVPPDSYRDPHDEEYPNAYD